MDDVSRRSVRRTFLVLSCVLCLWAYRFYPSYPAYVLFGLALSILFISIISPARLMPVFKVMRRCGRMIGEINTRLLLGLVYLFFFPLFRVFIALAGKDFMKRKIGGCESYWEDCRLAGLDDISRYERLF